MKYSLYLRIPRGRERRILPKSELLQPNDESLYQRRQLQSRSKESICLESKTFGLVGTDELGVAILGIYSKDSGIMGGVDVPSPHDEDWLVDISLNPDYKKKKDMWSFISEDNIYLMQFVFLMITR